MENMDKILVRQEGSPCPSKKLRSGRRYGSGQDKHKGPVKESNPVAWDQISILPKEILSMIFEHLDFRSFKQARQVCKRWYQAAEFHFKTKAIVRLNKNGDGSSRIEEFLRMTEMTKKRKRALSQPFKAIDVDLSRDDKLPSRARLNKLICSSSPLVLTRFSAGLLPLKLTLPLLLKAASTLEYLFLNTGSSEKGYEPPQGPQQQLFPKLETVFVEHPSKPDTALTWKHSPLIVAWVVNGSPNLEDFFTFSLFLNKDPRGTLYEFHSEILLQLDLKTVKTLRLSLDGLSEAALEHFLATPFSRLQELKLDSVFLDYPAVVRVVKRTRDTLKSLSLCAIESARRLVDLGFPICSNVEALTLTNFPDQERFSESLLFLSEYFPRLQELSIFTLSICSGGYVENSLSPLRGLKTLRISIFCSGGEGSDEDWSQSPGDEFLFLQPFPDLETLDMEPSHVVRLCALKADRDPVCATLLEGLKHLELSGDPLSESVDDFSHLSQLKGLETVSFGLSEGITTVPAKDMPSLKMIQFPWDRHDLELKELLNLARSVEKVVLTNCCSLPGSLRETSKELLNEFFQSAPNAVCGCKETKESSFRWF